MSIKSEYKKLKKVYKKINLPFEINLEVYTELRKQNCHICGGEGHGLACLDYQNGMVLGNIISQCILCQSVRNNFDSLQDMFAYIVHLYFKHQPKQEMPRGYA